MMAKEQTASPSFFSKIAAYREKPLVKDTISTTILSTIGKGFGFLIPFFLAAWYGISKETDVFFFVYGLVLFAANLFAPVLESVIVPFVSEQKALADKALVVSCTLIVSSLFMLTFMALFMLIGPWLIMTFTSFSQGSQHLLYQLLLQTSPLMILLVLGSILAGALNATKDFAWPAISPAIRAVIALTVIYLFQNGLGINAVALGYLLGEFARVLLLLFIALRKKLLAWQEQIFSQLSRVIELMKTASYQVIGMLMVGFSPIIDKTMASWLGSGSVSILEYAQRIYLIPLTFFVSGFLVVLLSTWSNDFYRNIENINKQTFYLKVMNMIKVVGLVCLSVSLASIFLSFNFVKLVYGFGKFPQEKIVPVTLALIFYLIGLAPYMASQVLVRAYITLKNTVVLLKASMYSFTVNILGNLILMQYLGVSGIALSSSLTSLSIAFYFLVKLKKLGASDGKSRVR